MLRLRLAEQPAPAGMKDGEMLLSWLLETLGLVRRRNESDSSKAANRPLNRLLRDNLLAEPKYGRDAKQLSESLEISMTALHHHLKGLQATRLITSQEGKNGWRVHFVRSGSLAGAIELLQSETIGILKMRLSLLNEWRTGKISIPDQIDNDPPALKLRICEFRPLVEEEDEIDAFLNDCGLRGDRPNQISGEDLTRQVFIELLRAKRPLSLDEAAEKWGATRPRMTRCFERFRQAGLVDRVLRTDRLSVILWDAIQAQYSRRGEAWLLGKGGLGRLDKRVGKQVTKSLNEGNFTSKRCEKLFEKVGLEEKLLAINLLGGRLPYGYRMAGETGDDLAMHVQLRVEGMFSRLKRVAVILDEQFALA